MAIKKVAFSMIHLLSAGRFASRSAARANMNKATQMHIAAVKNLVLTIYGRKIPPNATVAIHRFERSSIF